MRDIDHLEAMLGLLRPEDLTNLSPARLKRLGDSLYVAHSWCRLAERQAVPVPKASALAKLGKGERQHE